MGNSKNYRFFTGSHHDFFVFIRGEFLLNLCFVVDRLLKLCYSEHIYVIVVSVNDGADSTAYIIK